MTERLRHRITIVGLALTAISSLTLGTHLVEDGAMRTVDLVVVFGGGVATGAAIALISQRRRSRRRKSGGSR